MDLILFYSGQAAELLQTLYSGHFTGKVTVAAAVFTILVIAIDLHRRGYRMSWTRRLVASFWTNMAFWFGNILFTPAVVFMAGAVQHAYDSLGIPHIDGAVWEGLSPWLLVPLAIFCYDFANYWNHRVMHMRLLWPIHAVHHSDAETNVLSSFRIHFLEGVVMLASYTLLLSWLGFPPNVMGFGAAIITIHNMYVHINLDWDHGPFRYVLASPVLHRWHHAKDPAAYGKNLANIFPVFDLMFGTYYLPGLCRKPLGADGVPENDVIKLWLFPFREWVSMLTSAVKVRSVGKHDETAPSNVHFTQTEAGN